MSIINEHSVLILGAGVSAQFGLPLGGELIKMLSKNISGELTYLRNEFQSVTNPLPLILKRGILNYNNVFENIPMHATIAARNWDPIREEFSNYDKINSEIDDLKMLRNLLVSQTSETIDNFIVENPKYSTLVKIGIASIFLRSCYSWRDNSMLPKIFGARYFNPISGNVDEDKADTSDRNWIHLLINIIREGINDKIITEDNKVRIITFNYDMILEYVLEKQFTNTGMDYAHYSKYVEILHVHGKCGEIQNELKNPAIECGEWAEGIHAVKEPNLPSDIAVIQSRAQNLVLNSAEIYACGFHFSRSNCEMLNLNRSNTEAIEHRKITFCNYDGNIGLSNAANVFKTKKGGINYVPTEVVEAKPQQEDSLEVANWIQRGYLGW